MTPRQNPGPAGRPGLIAYHARISHRAYRTFFLRKGGQASFLEDDATTPPSAVSPSPTRHPELALRGGALATSQVRQMLEYGFENRRGGMWLNLTPDQYGRLRR
jgi:hypothetical protein